MNLRLELGPGVLERMTPLQGGLYLEEGIYRDNHGRHICAVVQQGVPEYAEFYHPVTDATGRVTILIPESMEFVDNRVFVEFYTYQGQGSFICRTLIPIPR